MATTAQEYDHHASYRQMTESELRTAYWGAWNATDRSGAYCAKKELVRRGLDVTHMGWPSLDLSTWISY